MSEERKFVLGWFVICIPGMLAVVGLLQLLKLVVPDHGWVTFSVYMSFSLAAPFIILGVPLLLIMALDAWMRRP